MSVPRIAAGITAVEVTSMGSNKRAKARFGLPEDARVVCCYEAGRDGFWIHRFLLSQGIDNVVVDSSSIEVNRRKRRANGRWDVQETVAGWSLSNRT